MGLVHQGSASTTRRTNCSARIIEPMLPSCSLSLRSAVGLWLLFVAIGVECAPRMVTGLTVGADGFGAPTPVWAAIIDPATFSKIVDLPTGQYGVGVVTSDLHGHRAYLAARAG